MAIMLVALVLVVLIVFTAFAVDIGTVYAERRQDQSAADMAALAAAQDLNGAEADIVAKAKEYAHDTLGHSLPEGTGGWNGCPRPDSSALRYQAANNSCISYDDNRARVRLPDQYVEAGFGQVVGIDDYRHSAFAVAGQFTGGFGSILPFFVSNAKAANGFDCLIASGPSPCDPTTGNFFPMRFSFHTPSCDIGGNTNRDLQMLEQNSANGIDHLVSRYNRPPYGTQVVVDTAATCPRLANAGETFTGNQHDSVRAGLLTGTGYVGGPARLRRQASGPGVPSLPRTVSGVFGVSGTLDDTPLWWFIPENYGPQFGNANIPRSCQRNQFVNSTGQYYGDVRTNSNITDAFVRNHIAAMSTEADRVLALLIRCFDHYAGRSWDGAPGSLASPEAPVGCSSACSSPVFGLNSTSNDVPDLYDIQYTPRFGYSPETVAVPPGGSGTVRFDDFQALYLYRFLLGNQNNAGNSLRWDPGVEPRPSGPLPNNVNNQTAVAAFYFSPGMLPNRLTDPDAPSLVGVNRFIQLLR